MMFILLIAHLNFEGDYMEVVSYIAIAILLLFIYKRLMPIKGVRNLSIADLKSELSDKNKQFIDVRTEGEFKGFHIRGFKNIPLHELAKKADKELSKEKEVIVICQSGMRSKQASKLLRRLGFSTVSNVKNGVNAWTTAK